LLPFLLTPRYWPLMLGPCRREFKFRTVLKLADSWKAVLCMFPLPTLWLLLVLQIVSTKRTTTIAAAAEVHASKAAIVLRCEHVCVREFVYTFMHFIQLVIYLCSLGQSCSALVRNKGAQLDGRGRRTCRLIAFL